jgi:hypothetical protein
LGPCLLLYDRVSGRFSIVGGNSDIDGPALATVSPHGRYVAWADPFVNVSEMATNNVLLDTDGVPCCDGTYEALRSGDEHHMLAYDWSQRVGRINLATGRVRRLVRGSSCWKSSGNRPDRYVRSEGATSLVRKRLVFLKLPEASCRCTVATDDWQAGAAASVDRPSGRFDVWSIDCHDNALRPRRVLTEG